MMFEDSKFDELVRLEIERCGHDPNSSGGFSWVAFEDRVRDRLADIEIEKKYHEFHE